MTDPNIANHTLELLRRIDERTSAMQDTLNHLHTDMASMQKSHGAIMSMIGGQHDRMNEFTRRLERLERLMESASDA